MCSSDYIGIRAMEDFFRYHNVPLESLHLPNKSCRAQKTIIDDVTYYTSRISKEEYLTCGGKPLEVQLEHLREDEHFSGFPCQSLFVFCLFTEKLYPRHIFLKSAVRPSDYWKHNQEPSHQAGLQMRLSLCQESQPAVPSRPLFHVRMLN